MPRLTMQDIRELREALSYVKEHRGIPPGHPALCREWQHQDMLNYAILGEKAEKHIPAMADAIEELVKVAQAAESANYIIECPPRLYKALRDFQAGEFAGLLELNR